MAARAAAVPLLEPLAAVGGAAVAARYAGVAAGGAPYVGDRCVGDRIVDAAAAGGRAGGRSVDVEVDVALQRERHLAQVVVGDALEDAEVDARRPELVGAEGVLVKRLELERLLEEVALDAGELEVLAPLGVDDLLITFDCFFWPPSSSLTYGSESLAVLRRQVDGAQQVDAASLDASGAFPSRPTRPRT